MLPPEFLSPRELEVVKLVADGLREKVIAGRLGITHATVRVHVWNIAAKLELPSDADRHVLIARWWLEHAA